MINNGYIKVFRSIMDKGWYKDSECVALWLHLLLKANHKGAEFMLGYSIIKLLPGQLVTGRKALSYETGISESKIERILKLFEIEQQIEQQTNSRNRIITILSWDAYQKSEQQMDSPRTASEQPVDTNKKKKNNKNDNNEKKEIELPFSSQDFLDVWNVLINQPKWSKKTVDALKASLKILEKHKEHIAIGMMQKCIASGWQGLFELSDKESAELEKQYIKKQIEIRDSKTRNKW
jgi:hypothetical protein